MKANLFLNTSGRNIQNSSKWHYFCFQIIGLFTISELPYVSLFFYKGRGQFVLLPLDQDGKW